MFGDYILDSGAASSGRIGVWESPNPLAHSLMQFQPFVGYGVDSWSETWK